MLRVFIGYDPRQPVAYQVLAHSVAARASRPVSIIRLQLNQLAPFTRRGLTEFTFSRYLVPYLSGYEGLSVFLDADMLCLGDIVNLEALAAAECVAQMAIAQAHGQATKPDDVFGPSVFVVKNERRFEWPSMMVFNNARCRTLTPEWVGDEKNNPYALESWADAGIGGLPAEWNQLVNYDPPNPKAKLVHFTMGIPCWPETRDCEFSAEWHREAKATVSSVSFKELMGNSVHAKHVYKRLQDKAAGVAA